MVLLLIVQNYPEFETDESKNVRRLEEAERVWNKILESFKQRSLMLKSQSREAYEVYFTKAAKALKETSKDIKIQADKASLDIAAIAKEIREEGVEYLVYADENSPDSVKDVVEVFSAPPEFNDVSNAHDFHLGIPYGIPYIISTAIDMEPDGALMISSYPYHSLNQN